MSVNLTYLSGHLTRLGLRFGILGLLKLRQKLLLAKNGFNANFWTALRTRLTLIRGLGMSASIAAVVYNLKEGAKRRGRETGLDRGTTLSAMLEPLRRQTAALRDPVRDNMALDAEIDGSDAAVDVNRVERRLRNRTRLFKFLVCFGLISETHPPLNAFIMFPSHKKMSRILSNPFIRLGIPGMATVVLGTLFYSEIVRINNLIPSRASGIKEEDIVDSFDVERELQVC